MALSSALRGILGGCLAHSPNHVSQLDSVRLCSTLTTSKLFISGLARHTSDEGLRKAFEPFRNLIEAKVITDRATGRSKGFWFVTYETIEEAQKAQEGLNAKYLDGWVIFVDPAKPREFRAPPQAEREGLSLGITSNKTVGWSG